MSIVMPQEKGPTMKTENHLIPAFIRKKCMACKICVDDCPVSCIGVETSGTAKWIAEQVLSVVGDAPGWVIQTSVAALATFFTLVMSNVGATVLLVPLAVNIALGAGANPAVFALTVAIATSNSFLIPTHQVNALIMGPAGYRVADFMRAGGIMTVLFLLVSVTMLNILF